jgi:SAM-dependent methyltransferase
MNPVQANYELGPLHIPVTANKKVADVGCGMNKVPGAFGIDIFKYENVDQVVDLNSTPWPIAENSFDFIVVRHVIEHIDNLTGFMKELHRISRPSAEIYFETPHFSSINSWNDPTHRLHLSSRWHENFLPGNYLGAQAGYFNLKRSKVTFGKSLRARLGSLYVKLRGLSRWEKNCAFIYPGMDIITLLEVLKP